MRVFEDVERTLAVLGQRAVALGIASNFDARLKRIACGWKTVLLGRSGQAREQFSIRTLSEVLAML
jgi:FMN phosphatase YigB (HAD superfamily)